MSIKHGTGLPREVIAVGIYFLQSRARLFVIAAV